MRRFRFGSLSVIAACFYFVAFTGAAKTASAHLPRLKVSDNRRFLATEDNKPFFYLADTAWDLSHRLTREDADFYLASRARQGFTVIQAVALDVEGVTRTNAYGEAHLNRPYFTRVPDQELLADDRGDSLYHLQATRCSDGSYAFVYCPDSRPFTVKLDRLVASSLTAWWFNPRTGKATEIGALKEKGSKQFTPPTGPNPYNDWVLVLDGASRKFPPPGVSG